MGGWQVMWLCMVVTRSVVFRSRSRGGEGVVRATSEFIAVDDAGLPRAGEQQQI